MAMSQSQYKQGFTIVELLIVIVVIAILAAISIVAYTGIQNRGRASAAQAAASGLVKKAEIYFSINGQYPTTTGVITGSGTQNSVTTTSTSDWYSNAFTTVAGAANTTNGMYNGKAAPAQPATLYWTNGNASNGGCVWWYDFQNTTWKSMKVGSVTCPALPANSSSALASVAI